MKRQATENFESIVGTMRNQIHAVESEYSDRAGSVALAMVNLFCNLLLTNNKREIPWKLFFSEFEVERGSGLGDYKNSNQAVPGEGTMLVLNFANLEFKLGVSPEGNIFFCTNDGIPPVAVYLSQAIHLYLESINSFKVG